MCSMKCAVILLVILAVACTAGSLILQGQTAAYYTANYPESLAGAVLLFHLDDVFHCWWFVGLTIFLCANLLACNVLRFPALRKRMKDGFTVTKRIAEWDGVPAAVTAEEPEEIFKRLGFRNVTRGVMAVTRLTQTEDAAGVVEDAAMCASGIEAAGPDGLTAADASAPVPDREYAAVSEMTETAVTGAAGPESVPTRYAVRNRVGVWGAWLCHLGMLVVVAGFGLGQMFQVQYSVYGVPGQTKPIGDTGYELRIDDFQVKLREDDTVEQYETVMTVTHAGENTDVAGAAGTETGETGITGITGANETAATVSVNHPVTIHGMKFYQNSTGWAATVQIYKGSELLQQGVICAGEYALVEDMEGLAVLLNAFYPDYIRGADGMPVTASSALNNPGYLYTLYYNDRILGMNVLTEDEIITVEDYGIRFTDPQQHTLIQVKRDPFTPVAAAGGLLVMLSLVLAFYLPPEEVWAVQRSDGTWALAGRSRKAGAYFLEELAKYSGKVPAGSPPEDGNKQTE